MRNSERPTHNSAAPPAACGASLADADPGVRYAVVRVGRDRAAALAREGVVPGAPILVEKRLPLGGPLILRVGATRLALARPVAAQVAVGPEGGQ